MTKLGDLTVCFPSKKEPVASTGIMSTCQCHGQRDINRGQQPEEDDGEEAAHREED